MASKKGNTKFYHTTSQQAYYMKPSEAKTVSLAGGPAVTGDVPRPRIGMVLMTKRPLDLEDWLRYHRRAPCGVGTREGRAANDRYR